jgi:hypothetical protein
MVQIACESDTLEKAKLQRQLEWTDKELRELNALAIEEGRHDV